MIAVWVLTCLIWSTVWLFIKIGVRDVPPLTFAGLRLLVAFAVLAPVVVLRGAQLPRSTRDWRLIGTSGVLLLGVNYALLYWGTQYIPSGLTAVLQAASPAFSLLFEHFWTRDERITIGKTAALGLGIAGVAAVCSNQLHASGERALLGSLAVLAGAACVAVAYVLVRSRGCHLDRTLLMTAQTFCGMVPLIAVALLREGNPFTFRWTSAAIASLLYLALVGSVVGFWLNYWLLRRMSATAVLVMAIVEPLLAMLLGAIVLDETLPPATAVGAVAIMSSAALLLR